MFRHLGNTRTPSHNLKIASLLSFVAGLVCVGGFFAVQHLTTNVTGHFAFFVDEMSQLNFWKGIVYFLYIFFFFSGSFVSNFLIEYLSRKDIRHIYEVPALLECMMLSFIGFYGHKLIVNHSEAIAYSLLFAMGLQNSLVTKISNSSVRTTHLTGLFTDLGIEFSQLFFYKEPHQKGRLLSSIRLRLTIILFFFIGGSVGGLLYSRLEFHVFNVAAGTLIVGLIYHKIKDYFASLKQKLNEA